MKRLRTIRLAIHPGRDSITWSLIHRTDDGRTVFDRRLHSGLIDHMGTVTGIADVPTTLRQIADEIDSRHGVPPAEGGSGAPGGGGGRPEDHRPGRVCASDCPLCGEHLDGMPSDD